MGLILGSSSFVGLWCLATGPSMLLFSSFLSVAEFSLLMDHVSLSLAQHHFSWGRIRRDFEFGFRETKSRSGDLQSGQSWTFSMGGRLVLRRKMTVVATRMSCDMVM